MRQCQHEKNANLDRLERGEARIRARVERPFRRIKRRCWRVKVRYHGLLRNTAKLHTLLTLNKLWMAHRKLLQEVQGRARMRAARGTKRSVSHHLPF